LSYKQNNMKNQSNHIIDERLFENLDKFRSLDAAEDWAKVRVRMGIPTEDHPRVSAEKRGHLWYWSAAATIIILLGVGWLTGRIQLTTPNMVVASTGETKREVLLPDGSVVNLNRNSELSYPEKFGRKSREVSFSGEGYFEVTRYPHKPFLIHIADLAGVEVLGTAFNINALPDDQSVKVNVVEGRVAFFSSSSPGKRTILRKDEKAVLQSGNISQGKTVDQNFLSWRTGLLSFDQENITSVLEDLGSYYDRRFILEDPADEQLRFTSVIDNQDLESVLEELNLVLGLEHRTEGKTITLYRPD
jgi:transmembrane sensor